MPILDIALITVSMSLCLVYSNCCLIAWSRLATLLRRLTPDRLVFLPGWADSATCNPIEKLGKPQWESCNLSRLFAEGNWLPYPAMTISAKTAGKGKNSAWFQKRRIPIIIVTSITSAIIRIKIFRTSWNNQSVSTFKWRGRTVRMRMFSVTWYFELNVYMFREVEANRCRLYARRII